MKLTRQIKARLVPKSPKGPYIIFDEAPLLFRPSNDGLSSMMQFQRRPGARVMVATQAVIKSNSGKRLRLIGSTRWSDGAPLKSAPKKFVPAQVVRRQASK